MAEHDWIFAAVIGIIVVVIVVTFIETRLLRKSMKARRVRAAKRVDELPDDAHNALVTARAILATLEKGGVRSEEAAQMLRDAQSAYARQNYRVVLDLTSKAKTRLMELKAKQSAQGDLAKLEGSPPAGDEPTTKEVLQKEYPPNFLQSRFALELARSSVEGAKAAGRDAAQAETLLARAQGRFDAKDYAAALAVARQAQRSADSGPIEGLVIPPETPAPPPASAPAAPPSAGLACVSCGAALASDDVFCRKCGTRVAPSACRSCGTSLVAGDGFCRKCGTPIGP